MDPAKASPLDAWASKHVSIASNISVDILGEFPPPVPPKPAKQQKELPPLPESKFLESPRQERPYPRGNSAQNEYNFDFEARSPSVGSVMAHRTVVHTPPIPKPCSAREPPSSFAFESVEDHLRMAVYQIEAGTLEWAKFHLNHAASNGSVDGRFLWDVGAEVGWWSWSSSSGGGPQEGKFPYLDQISLSRLRQLAGDPAPHLATALASLGRYGPFFMQASKAMDAPSQAKLKQQGNHTPNGPKMPKSRKPTDTHTHSHSQSQTIYSQLPKAPSFHSQPHLPLDPAVVVVPPPFAKTHGRSDSSNSLKSINSAHKFPYPWRHSRNNSQASMSSNK